MPTVLLTDGLQRKTLVAARSLGRAGWHVLVSDDSPFSMTRFSRHVRKGLVSPHPARPEFRSWLCRMAEHVDLVLPMDDDSTEAVSELADRLPCRTLVPRPEQFRTFRDKLETVRIAEETGIPHPRTFTLREAGVEAGLAALGGVGVLRARQGSGGRGIHFLRPGGPVPALDPDQHFIQERIPLGRKFDVGLLYDGERRLRAHFVQEELRWFPGEHGASTVQRSVDRPDLVRLAEKLIAPVGWQGPVEVEFMLDPDGTPRLMEVNPRFWASLGLAVAAGVDFPRLLADLALGRPADGPLLYRTDLLCRWSLPADLLHALAHPLRGLGGDPAFPRPGEVVVDDIVSSEDPGPLFGFGLAALVRLFDVATWRMMLRW